MVEEGKIHVDIFALVQKLLNEKDDGGVNWEVIDMAGAVILWVSRPSGLRPVWSPTPPRA